MERAYYEEPAAAFARMRLRELMVKTAGTADVAQMGELDRALLDRPLAELADGERRRLIARGLDAGGRGRRSCWTLAAGAVSSSGRCWRRSLHCR